MSDETRAVSKDIAGLENEIPTLNHVFGDQGVMSSKTQKMMTRILAVDAGYNNQEARLAKMERTRKSEVSNIRRRQKASKRCMYIARIRVSTVGHHRLWFLVS